MGDSKYTETIKVALYGKYGCGKTRAIGELMAAGLKVVVVSAEHGLGTINSLLTPDNVIEAAKQVDTIDSRPAAGRCCWLCGRHG